VTAGAGFTDPIEVDHSPVSDPAVAREIAHLQRRYERARTARDAANGRLDQLAAELLGLMLEQEIEASATGGGRAGDRGIA
jgi:hypothetical protein